ncbi:MAG: hypothetical protein PCFJNLEI_03610 [Verrucomicrobiae bacterium]|nr:hypothetical protein [Verrucomicrobiae bacterium]
MAVAFVGCQRGPSQCSVCEREECKGLTFRITLPAKKTVETCCARCGLHYLAGSSAAQKAEATDFSTGKWIDATTASYVSGSDVHPCATVNAQRDAQGCCVFKGYDRCLPSLVAFAKDTDAQAFARQRGGEVVTWVQLRRQP